MRSRTFISDKELKHLNKRHALYNATSWQQVIRLDSINSVLVNVLITHETVRCDRSFESSLGDDSNEWSHRCVSIRYNEGNMQNVNSFF